MRAARQVLSERLGGQAERGGAFGLGNRLCRAAYGHVGRPKAITSNERLAQQQPQASDCLWAMGDVVAMLDAGQAKEESAARPPFEVYE